MNAWQQRLFVASEWEMVYYTVCRISMEIFDSFFFSLLPTYWAKSNRTREWISEWEDLESKLQNLCTFMPSTKSMALVKIRSDVQYNTSTHTHTHANVYVRIIIIILHVWLFYTRVAMKMRHGNKAMGRFCVTRPSSTNKKKRITVFDCEPKVRWRNTHTTNWPPNTSWQKQKLTERRERQTYLQGNLFFFFLVGSFGHFGSIEFTPKYTDTRHAKLKNDRKLTKTKIKMDTYTLLNEHGQDGQAVAHSQKLAEPKQSTQ